MEIMLLEDEIQTCFNGLVYLRELDSDDRKTIMARMENASNELTRLRGELTTEDTEYSTEVFEFSFEKKPLCNSVKTSDNSVVNRKEADNA